MHVLFEDDDLLVVDKPSGLVVHRGHSGESDSVMSRLARLGYATLHNVHRLDRGTSGLLLLAQHAQAARELGDFFARGLVEKTYFAIVRGAVSDAPVLVDHPIPRDEGASRVPARTWIRGLATISVASSPLREKRYSSIEARPLTGRFHQVRRHAKHLGHPIVGDTTYGRSEHNQLITERFGLSRLALHASTLTIPPLPCRASGPLTFESPLPDDLARVMQSENSRPRAAGGEADEN